MKQNQSTKQIPFFEFGFPQNNTELHIPLSHQAQLTMFEFKPYGVVEYLLRLGPEFEDNFKPISPQNITKTIAINLFHLFLGLSEFFDADLELDSHLSDKYKYKTDEPWRQKNGMLHWKELYSRTSEQRTLWERVFCPFFGGCPYLGGSPCFDYKCCLNRVISINNAIDT